MALSILLGCSMYPFQALLKRATVAPSTTLWSADHEMFMTVLGTATAVPLSTSAAVAALPVVEDTYLGSTCMRPKAPMATCGTTSTGVA
jgi:hypothetical protein